MPHGLPKPSASRRSLASLPRNLARRRVRPVPVTRTVPCDWTCHSQESSRATTMTSRWWREISAIRSICDAKSILCQLSLTGRRGDHEVRVVGAAARLCGDFTRSHTSCGSKALMSFTKGARDGRREFELFGRLHADWAINLTCQGYCAHRLAGSGKRAIGLGEGL